MKIRENEHHCKIRAARDYLNARFLFFNFNEITEKKAAFI